MYADLASDGDQTRDCRDTMDEYSNGCGGAAHKGRPMVVCTQYLGDDLDIEAIHPSQWKIIKGSGRGTDLWLQVLSVWTLVQGPRPTFISSELGKWVKV